MSGEEHIYDEHRTIVRMPDGLWAVADGPYDDGRFAHRQALNLIRQGGHPAEDVRTVCGRLPDMLRLSRWTDEQVASVTSRIYEPADGASPAGFDTPAAANDEIRQMAHRMNSFNVTLPTDADLYEIHDRAAEIISVLPKLRFPMTDEIEAENERWRNAHTGAHNVLSRAKLILTAREDKRCRALHGSPEVGGAPGEDGP